MFKNFSRKTLLASTLLVSASLCGAPAFAQDVGNEQVPPDQTLPDPSEDPTVAPEPAVPDTPPASQAAEIIVTGTRITNPNLTASSPVNVVGEAELEIRQAVIAEEVLRDLPGVAPGLGRPVNNGSNGSAQLNLRGLGTNRNLVLLDGSRIVGTDLEGVPDLNNIPVALLDRFEVVTGGASSVYGADAIAGVANFITKRDFAGVDLTATMGINQEGDGRLFRSDLTVGANFDDGRGNVVLSLGYIKAKPVLQGDREYSRDTIFVEGSAIGSGTTVPTRLNPGGGFIQLDPASQTLVPTFNTFNFAPFNYFLTPFDRHNVFAQGHYELSEGIEAYAQGMFSRNQVQLRLAPSGLFLATMQFPLNNPFITDAIRDTICERAGVDPATCVAADNPDLRPGDEGFVQVPIQFARRLVEQGARLRDIDTRMFQSKIGLRGELTPTVEWDIHGLYGNSNRFERNRNWGSRSRIQQALFASDPDTCFDPTGGCVPINLFGGGTGQNITPEQVAFFNIPSTTSNENELAVVNASLSGDIGWAIPWAETPIGFAVGAEYRRHAAAIRPDFLTSQPDEVLGTGAPDPAVDGEYDVKEIFGETIVTLIENRPGFHELNLEGGIRFSDYSTTGRSTTWKAGGNYEPFPGYRARAIYQVAVRSPNVDELFSPQITGLGNLPVDPCEGTLAQIRARGGNFEQLCLEQLARVGLPASVLGTISPPSAGQINVTSGGNPNVDVERARTFTAGVVLTPPQIPRFSASIDYYRIKINDAITTPTEGDVIGGCFERNDPAFCQLIFRDPFTGSLTGESATTPGLLLLLTNQGTIETSGIDAIASYRLPTGFGGLAFHANVNRTLEQKFQASETSINRECVGLYSENCDPPGPKWSGNLRTTASFGDSSDLSLLYRYIGPVDYEFAPDDFVLDEFEHIGARHYFDLAYMQRVGERFQFTVGVNNIFNKKPPMVSSFIGSTAYNSGNTYPIVYDVQGRRLQTTVNLRF